MTSFLLHSNRREKVFLLIEGLVKFHHISIYTIDIYLLVLKQLYRIYVFSH